MLLDVSKMLLPLAPVVRLAIFTLGLISKVGASLSNWLLSNTGHGSPYGSLPTAYVCLFTACSVRVSRESCPVSKTQILRVVFNYLL